jgi:putative transposase
MIVTALLLIRDLLQFLVSACASHTRLAAENLFLRKQLAFFVERKVKPRRLNDAARITLVVLARLIDWRQFVVVVRPETFVRWHRQGFRLFWSWKSRRPGRPRIPVSLQNLIADTARANQTWGEERIAAELLLKLVWSANIPSGETWRFIYCCRPNELACAA